MGVIHHSLSTFIKCVEHSLHGVVKVPNSLKSSPNVRYLVCMLASNGVYARTCKNPRPEKGYLVQKIIETNLLCSNYFLFLLHNDSALFGFSVTLSSS